MRNSSLETQIFSISGEDDFNKGSLEVFLYQYEHCFVYKQFVDALKINPNLISHYSNIPFLPISFFKTHKVVCSEQVNPIVFESSKTTGQISSKHVVNYINMYETSFQKGFSYMYGSPEEYIVLALLPSYLERENSSLVYMVDDLIQNSMKDESGFFLSDFEKIYAIIQENKHKKIMLLGVSFALLDFAEQYEFTHPNIIIMETGGMKGRKKEITRHEIHTILKKSFHVESIHSEYGMTELLSQAYAQKNGLFQSVPWMKIQIRDMYDPFTLMPWNKLGGINVIDLANLYSCSFIETQDIGRMAEDGKFTVEGRFDSSEIRGCNLMYQ